MKKIGILGGTFNPIHLGHLILAEEVREELKLDKVIFVPTNLPPHKHNNILESKYRFNMIKLAIGDNSHFDVSDIEIKRGGVSFTIETLKAMRSHYKRAQLFFISGSDVLKYLPKWKDLDRILKIAKFVVANRPGYSLNKIPRKITTLEIRPLAISAYEIRKLIRKKRSIRYFVPKEVFKYIEKNRLYSKN
ncbi:MAG: nicotinate-nucleotide adenylyltransferase [Candidatus Gygaella obscura]|nr:nicotinate-nucleotide adenylyltransferase [Candidatus Gygaella obscura]